MKIKGSDVDPGNISKLIPARESDKRVEQSSNSKFLGFMEKSTEVNLQDKMKKLAQDLLEQGDKLAKRVDVQELKVYKSLIQEFLNQVVNNAHKFTKNNKIDRRGRYKVFVTVKKINEEVDVLSQEVLSNQVDNLKILKKIQDIRGLILDLEL